MGRSSSVSPITATVLRPPGRTRSIRAGACQRLKICPYFSRATNAIRRMAGESYRSICGGLVMFCASIRTLWKRLVFRGVDFSDKHGAFETAYLVSDPYNLESPQEQHRFVQTNRIIEETFGHVDNILEIGCGEGRQSFYLQELCDRLEGIDISNRAVERARKHCPQGIFRQGDIVDCSGHFDLVTAFEVVYYSSDIANVLERMSALGNACILSYWQGYAERLDPYFKHIPASERASISYGDVNWNVVWWRNS